MRNGWVLVLLCLGACDGGDCPNQAPTLDWQLTTPEGFEVRSDRSSGGELTFSIENAVADPEGDPLFFVWYRQVPDADPVPQVGDTTMKLDPCETFSLQDAARVNITVVVSDQPIDFDPGAVPFPVSGSSASMTVRAWTVELMGECP